MSDVAILSKDCFVVALLLLAMLGRWTIFGILRPRVRVRHVEGARPMARRTA